MAQVERADAVMFNFCNPAPGWTGEKVPTKPRGQKWLFNFNYEAPNVALCDNVEYNGIFNTAKHSVFLHS